MKDPSSGWVGRGRIAHQTSEGNMVELTKKGFSNLRSTRIGKRGKLAGR